MPYIPQIPNPLADPELARYGFNNSLMSAAEAMLQAGAPSPHPRGGFANALGAGLIGFSRGQKEAVQTALSQRLLSMQMQKLKREEEAAQARERALATIGRGPQGVVSESEEGERTAEFDPMDMRGQEAAFARLAPEQYVAGKMRQPPKSLADITAEERAKYAGRPPPTHSATERLIAARNALLLKQSGGETLTNEEELNLNSWNDALIKGYVVPEGGNLTRVTLGQGTPLPTPGQPPQPPPQLQPKTEQRLKPLPRDVQDDLTAGLGMKRSLDQIAAGLHKSGRISGNIEKVKIWLGIGSQEGVDFDTAQKNFRVAAQALIKGIPSNFDVQTFINTLPDLGLPEQTNTARYSFATETLKELVATKVGYYRGLQYQIPDEITALAADLGVGDAPALTQGQATARLNVLQKGLTQFQGDAVGGAGDMSLEDAAKLDLSDPKNRERLDKALKARGF